MTQRPLVSLQIADTLISSGCVGVTLSKLLHERFPAARRSEVFLGVSIAITDLHCQLLEAAAEADGLRRELAALKVAWAPLPKIVT